MARKASSKPESSNSTATIGVESRVCGIWLAFGKLGDISIYGQDKWAWRQRPFGLGKRARWVRLRRQQQPKQSNATTRRLAVMNLAIRGIEADIGKEHADTFRVDQRPDLHADYVLANSPFNDTDRFHWDEAQ